MSNDGGWYDVDAHLGETDDSWHVQISGEDFNMPKAEVTYEEYDEEMQIPDWLAKKEGLLS